MVSRVKSSGRRVCLAASLLVVIVGGAAYASGVDTISPTLVEWWQGNGSSPQFIIQAGSTNYIASLGAPTGCDLTVNANIIDTLKAWQSLSTSALLAGKNLKIDFGTCTGGSGGAGRYIRSVDLVK